MIFQRCGVVAVLIHLKLDTSPQTDTSPPRSYFFISETILPSHTKHHSPTNTKHAKDATEVRQSTRPDENGANQLGVESVSQSVSQSVESVLPS